MTLAVTLSFVLLLALLAMALLWSTWPRWLKLMLVGGVSLFYFWAYEAVLGMWGWPSSDPLPPRFVLLAAVIEEPSAKQSGALYVWVNALENGKPAAKPRAYQLPYTKDLHSLINEGLKKARQGVTQMGTAEPKAGKRGLNWLRPGNDELEIKIRDLPAPQLPEK